MITSMLGRSSHARLAFSQQEEQMIQQQLDTKLEPEHISFRQAAAGTVAYLEGWKSLSLANDIFGFNGWSSEILQLTTEYLDITDGKVSIGITCMVRVSLKDGTFHDDVGFGMSENQRSKGAAYDKAKKEAVTDALKRALRQFGERLGNCAYNRDFVNRSRQQKHMKADLSYRKESNKLAEKHPEPAKLEENQFDFTETRTIFGLIFECEAFFEQEEMMSTELVAKPAPTTRRSTALCRPNLRDEGFRK